MIVERQWVAALVVFAVSVVVCMDFLLLAFDLWRKGGRRR